MPVAYKIDVLGALKDAGYTTYRLRNEKIFGQAIIQKFRTGNTDLTIQVIARLCGLLHCQPADILEYTEEAAND